MSKLVSNRRLSIFLYSLFSYSSYLIWNLLDLLPHFIRNLFFRIIFKRYGAGGLFDYRSFARYPWRVSIGNNVDINRGCELYSSMQTNQGTITLEDNVTLGPGVIIFSSSHDYKTPDYSDISAPVTICRNTWIGGKTIILPGITIGEGAVVGAGSIVTRNIPAYCVAVGSPARVIKKRIIEISEIK